MPPRLPSVIEPSRPPPTRAAAPAPIRDCVMRRPTPGVDRFVRTGACDRARPRPPDSTSPRRGRRCSPTSIRAAPWPTLATARVPRLAGLTRPDPVAPVMAGPVFTDAAYTAPRPGEPRRVRARARLDPGGLGDPRRDEPDLHRRLPRRAQQRPRPRAALARLPDRRARHVLAQLLGRRAGHRPAAPVLRRAARAT